ncbi:MAG: hypothetical protein ACRCWJ_04990 [Casimicrobium sp.]
MKRHLLLVVALFIFGIALWSRLSQSSNIGASLPVQAPSANVTAKASSTVLGANVGNASVLPDLLSAARLPNLLPNMLATRGTAAEMRHLRRSMSLGDAKLAAAQSDDPVLWINSLYMGLECMMPHFYRREPTEKKDEDDPIKARINKIVEDWMPYRVYLPTALQEHISRRTNELHGQDGKPSRATTYTEEDFALFLQMRAFVSEEDRAAFDLARARMHRECEHNMSEGFGRALRENRQRWLERGALGALIFDEKSGWTSSRTLSALSERDYELVARAITERSPDGLARLYLSPGAPIGKPLLGDNPGDWSFDAVVIPEMTRKLVLCELGLSDCSGGSSFHVDACGMHGGCHQADLASLIRYVLARDDLPPDLVDRNVARVIDAIHRGDLEALGIRRKSVP